MGHSHLRWVLVSAAASSILIAGCSHNSTSALDVVAQASAGQTATAPKPFDYAKAMSDPRISPQMKAQLGQVVAHQPASTPGTPASQ